MKLTVPAEVNVAFLPSCIWICRVAPRSHRIIIGVATKILRQGGAAVRILGVVRVGVLVGRLTRPRLASLPGCGFTQRSHVFRTESRGLTLEQFCIKNNA